MSAEDRHASSDHFQTTTANDPWNAWRALLLSGVHHFPSLPDFLSAAHVSEESGANRRSRFRATPRTDPHAATQIEAMKALETATSHDWSEKMTSSATPYCNCHALDNFYPCTTCENIRRTQAQIKAVFLDKQPEGASTCPIRKDQQQS